MMTETTVRLFIASEVRRTLELLLEADDSVCELRLLKAYLDNDRVPHTLYGYFDNIDLLIQQLQRVKRAMGFYITLQVCDSEILARSENTLQIAQQGDATPDSDILRWRWLLLDSDPKRKRGISSTEEEYELAEEHSASINTFLVDRWGCESVDADSGNGKHRLWRIDLDNTEENRALLQQVLAVLAEKFNTARVELDRGVFNAGRIDKLYGTKACKGSDTAKRPHRMSIIKDVPEPLVVITQEMLQALVNELTPQQQQKQSLPLPAGVSTLAGQNPNTAPAFLALHNMAYTRTSRGKLGPEPVTTYHLTVCPVDSSHTDNAACFHEYDKGNYAFTCSHTNTCKPKIDAAGSGWKLLQQILGIAPQKSAYGKMPSSQKKEKTAPTADELAAFDIALTNSDYAALKACKGVYVRLSANERSEREGAVKALVKANGLSWATFLEAAYELAGMDNEDELDLDVLAQEYYARYGKNLAYDPAYGVWREWDGQCWLEVDAKSHAAKRDQYVVDILHSADMCVTSMRTIDGVLRLASGKCMKEFDAHPRYINFNNGTLDLDTQNVHDHAREDALTKCLPYTYTAGAWPLIHSYMGITLTDPYARQAFMAQIGLGIVEDVTMINFIHAFGPTNSGKSTLLQIANLALGVLLYSSFAGDDLFSAEMEGMRQRYVYYKERGVCCDELSAHAFQNEGIIKNMSAHKGVPIRGIGKDAVKDNMWRAKLFMCSNHLPHYMDPSGAIQERALYLHTSKTLPEDKRDRTLIEQFKAEIGAFAYACIQVALAAQKRGYIPRSEEMAQHGKDAGTYANALRQFVDERLVLGASDPNSTHTGQLFITPADWIHAAYVRFCQERGHKFPKAQQSLTRELKDMNIGITSSKYPKYINGTTSMVLYGVRLRITDGAERDALPDELDQQAAAKIKELLVLPDFWDTSPPENAPPSSNKSSQRSQGSQGRETETLREAQAASEAHLEHVLRVLRVLPAIPLSDEKKEADLQQEHSFSLESGIGQKYPESPEKVLEPALELRQASQDAKIEALRTLRTLRTQDEPASTNGTIAGHASASNGSSMDDDDDEDILAPPKCARCRRPLIDEEGGCECRPIVVRNPGDQVYSARLMKAIESRMHMLRSILDEMEHLNLSIDSWSSSKLGYKSYKGWVRAEYEDFIEAVLAQDTNDNAAYARLEIERKRQAVRQRQLGREE